MAHIHDSEDRQLDKTGVRIVRDLGSGAVTTSGGVPKDPALVAFVRKTSAAADARKAALADRYRELSRSASDPTLARGYALLAKAVEAGS